jgi:hypothetical protein
MRTMVANSQDNRMTNALEAAINLVYLIRADHSDPNKVLEWAVLAEAQLQRIGSIIPGQSR